MQRCVVVFISLGFYCNFVLLCWINATAYKLLSLGNEKRGTICEAYLGTSATSLASSF